MENRYIREVKIIKQRIILIITVCMICLLSLAGCSKCIAERYETVEVQITNATYKPPYTTIQYNVALKIPMSVTHSAKYEVEVEYKGYHFSLTDSNTYEKYKDKIGEYVTGTLRTRTFDNETVKYDILSLE